MIEMGPNMDLDNLESDTDLDYGDTSCVIMKLDRLLLRKLLIFFWFFFKWSYAEPTKIGLILMKDGFR